METTLFQYARQHRGERRRVGVMCAQKCDDGSVVIAVSRCRTVASSTQAYLRQMGWNPAPCDTFNKDFGKQLCLDRIAAGHSKPVPQSMKDDVASFITRVKKYFKTDSVRVLGTDDVTISKAAKTVVAVAD